MNKYNNICNTNHVALIFKSIKTQTIGHAYLFTGTRGTGKTSVAKIFARAVNCANAINGGACGKCETLYPHIVKNILNSCSNALSWHQSEIKS